MHFHFIREHQRILSSFVIEPQPWGVVDWYILKNACSIDHTFLKQHGPQGRLKTKGKKWIHLSCFLDSTGEFPFSFFFPFFFFFFFFGFLGLRLQHMEVHRLGVWLELQVPAYTTARQNLSHASATYVTAHGNARSLTHQAGQGSNPQPHGF